MIIIMTGKPGTGKTYRAVFDAYQNRKKYFIIHNISGLKHDFFPHISTLDDVGGHATLTDFSAFRAVCQRIHDEYGLSTLWIIDECYRYLDKDYPGIKETMATHRHCGSTIWLIAQHLNMIATCYRRLIDFELRCKSSGLFGFLGVFLYAHRVEGEGFKLDFRRKRQDIYALYQSATLHVRHRSFLVPAAMVMIAFAGYWAFFTTPFKDPVPASVSRDAVHSNVVSASVPASVPAPVAQNSTVDARNRKMSYVGPEIISHVSSSVAFKTSSGVEAMPWSEFVRVFPPDIYGYSYVHSAPKNRLVVMDRDSSEIIYPVRNALRVRTYVRLEKPVAQTVDPFVGADMDSKMPNGLTRTQEVERLQLDAITKGQAYKVFPIQKK